ncbi:winged helix-turn-helix transcriptional regulator [Limosilactobacillus albertensis]|uniref:winged helix-turn-helix transcriptional regulator n=1 Tax=Limosilactobacillus albertensis TaxID=2759752 RepID=UPI001E5A3FFC|nr:winged helix-turn-helix transcriptional regulator [Limosilactobacillus albertensis]MCD7123073.1 winged helix-turn-helix transcriptional regulator [Limosilactobacillus albertensis]
MTERKDQCGVNYTLDVLEDKWQPRIIYWLGFRPFTIDELHRLLPELTLVALNDEIASLQNLRIVNSNKDENDKYTLTDNGTDLRNMVVTMGVWGRQQMDDSANQISDQIVEPEADASISSTIKNLISTCSAYKDVKKGNLDKSKLFFCYSEYLKCN